MSSTRAATLRAHVVARAEDRPGVYTWHGPGGELLYVGKSVRVRTRLLSYFRAEPGDKAARLVDDAARVDWSYVPNEFSALLTEMRLIQRRRPRYNVQHKRKVGYAFVKITREAAPRVLPVTRVVDDGSTYFGPFPRVRRVKETIRELAYALGLRDCPATVPVFFGDQLEIFGGAGAAAAPPRPPRCLRADLGTCLAPCCGRVTAADYASRVQDARRFLEGRGRAPLDLIAARMAEAVRAREFEYAAVLRDRRERLDRFQAELAAFRGEVEGLTFLYRVPGFKGNDRLYYVRRGRVVADLAHPKTGAARLDVARSLEEIGTDTDPGPGGLTGHQAAEILLVARWFRQKPREMERTRPLEAWLAERGLRRPRRPSA